MNLNFCIVIPFYNEEGRLKKVANAVRAKGYPAIYVNDGSEDEGWRDVKDEDCIEYYPNQGKGFAMRYGAEEAIKRGYEWIIFMDSDGQTNVEEVANFLEACKAYPYVSIFIGNRLGNPTGMPIIRYIANKLMSFIISLIARQWIDDSQCGFRMVHKDVFNIDYNYNRFEFESEMLIKVGRKRLIMKSVPISCIYEKGRISKIRPIKDTIRFFKMLLVFSTSSKIN